MYRDKSLVPVEAIRLAALGLLAQGPKPYAELAGAVRHFTQHLVGPSLELVGPPIELLKVEGLVTGDDATGDDGDRDAPLAITEAGHAELDRLLTSTVRAPVNDVGKLVVALKIRFLHLLDADDRADQAEALAEMFEGERARLLTLRGEMANEPGHLVAWLDLELAQTDARIEWCEKLAERV